MMHGRKNIKLGVSIVTTETTLRARWFGVRILVGVRDFSLFENAILALGPTRFIFHGYQGKATRARCWTLPTSSSEDKNEWNYISTPPMCLHCADGDDFTLIFLTLRTKTDLRCIWWYLSNPTENSMYSLIFTVAPCILILSKSFIYQLIHNRVALKEY